MLSGGQPCYLGAAVFCVLSGTEKSLKMPIINEKSLDREDFEMYNSKRLFAWIFDVFGREVGQLWIDFSWYRIISFRVTSPRR